MNFLQDAFISYGRADSLEFSRYLHQRLLNAGYAVWYDFHDIPQGVDYQKQIDDGIAKADNFVFIISPHATNSSYCRREINLAVALNKRLVPIMHVEQISRDTWQQRHPNGSEADWQTYTTAGKHSYSTNLHPELAKINWNQVSFKKGINDFDQSFQALTEIFERQKDYVRQHTILLNEALEWEHNQKQTRYLLIGEERQQAKAWLATQFKAEQPPCIPTDLHCEFVTESIKNANNLMTQVFLAHAEEDEKVTEQLRRSLMRAGITTWIHHSDIEFGTDFQTAMTRGVEEADNVILLLSPYSLNSPYCQQEIDLALTLNKRLIVLTTGKVTDDEVPAAIKNLQRIDLTDNLSEADYQQDESDLLRILKRNAAYYNEHKVLLTKALKWERQQRNPCILLQGYELQHALAWLKLSKQYPDHGPIPLQREFIVESERQPSGLSLDVFISYSRADSDFARKLNDGLQRQGKRTWFDQESIASGEDFKQEIYRGIAASDHFLFILSPKSVNSPYCADEVEYAAKLNKRILTVRYRAVETSDLHPELAKVQWIDFQGNDADFAANFKELIRTLDTDLEHLQFHTQLLLQAIAWDDRSRREDRLLRGEDLTEAKQWLLKAAGKQPRPTELQGDYVAASQALIDANRQIAAKQQRRLIGVLGSLLALAIAGSVVAFWQYRVATKQQQIALGRQLAAQAEALLQQLGRAPQSTLLAIEATRRLQDNAASASAAKNVLNDLRHIPLVPARIVGNTGETVSSSPTGKYIAVKRDARWTLWDVEANQELPLPVEQIQKLIFSSNDRYVGITTATEAILWDIIAEKTLPLPVTDVYTIEISHSPITSVEKTGQYAGIDGDAGWMVWDITTNQEIPLPGDSIYNLRFSPNGKHMGIDSGDGWMLWDVATEQAMPLPVDNIRELYFSPNGRYVGIQSDAGWQLWDIETQQTVALPQDNISKLSFSPTGVTSAESANNYVSLITSTGGTVWNIETKKAWTLPVNEIDDLFLSPNGQYVGLISNQSTAQVWDIKAKQEVSRVINEGKGGISSLSFSPNSQHVIATGWDGRLQLWHTEASQDVARVIHQGGDKQLEFSPDGRYVITHDGDNRLQVWDIEANRKIARIPVTHGSNINRLEFSPNSRIVTIKSDTGVMLWNLQTNRPLDLPVENIERWTFSPDSQYVGLKSDAGWGLWNLQTNQAVKLPAMDDIYELTFSPARTAISQSPSQYVGIRSETGATVWDIEINQGWTFPVENIETLNFSPDGQYISIYSDATGWLLRSIKENSTFPLPTDNIRTLFFSPDGRTVGIRHENGGILWDIHTNKTLLSLNTAIDNISFSSDGQYVGIQSDTGWTLWDVATKHKVSLPVETIDDLTFSLGRVTTSQESGQYVGIESEAGALLWEIGQAQGIHWPVENISRLEASPDGRTLAIRSDSGVILWDIETHQEVGNIIHKITPYDIKFSPTGKYLLTNSEDSALSWVVKSDALIAEVCSRLTRNLTMQEWQQYVSEKGYREGCEQLPNSNSNLSLRVI